MSSIYGESLKLSIFGQSHGKAIGMTLDGIPAGLSLDMEKLQLFLNRRAPGNHDYATSRKEADTPEFLSGIVNDHTCGAPISAIIRNSNTRSGDYAQLMDLPRPGHADLTAHLKYGGFQDAAGGGHFSGRLTAPLCIAGGMCLQWLEEMNIRIKAHISVCAGIADEPEVLDWANPDLAMIKTGFPVVNEDAGKSMQNAIAQAKSQGDSVGGLIKCFVTGLPAGLGDPIFGGMESRLAQIIYGIPAVKGLEFGTGFSSSYMRGSENNDSFCIDNGHIKSLHNYAGGILGGITDGMPLIFQVAIKPTPSISLPQKTVSMSRMEEATLSITGRHDPCIVPRAIPVIEAAAAIAVYDAILSQPIRRQ